MITKPNIPKKEKIYKADLSKYSLSLKFNIIATIEKINKIIPNNKITLISPFLLFLSLNI